MIAKSFIIIKCSEIKYDLEDYAHERKKKKKTTVQSLPLGTFIH